MLIAAGIWAAVWHPSAAWVESAFSNGYYVRWQAFWAGVTAGIPFSLGDVVVIVGVVVGVAQIVRGLRRPTRTVVALAAIGGLYSLWFYAGWGWGYDRGPVQDRVVFEPARIDSVAVAVIRMQTIAELNRLAPIAHSSHERTDFDEALLQTAWSPVVQRLGDTWRPAVSRAKPTLAGPFMDASGTSGFTNPFTLETQLAPDLLWFERPFSQAHEWAHVAGYNREDEANFIAVLTCLRDPDPIAQYSGRLELFLYLPPLKSYPHSAFVPLVWQDFAALRKRNAHFVNLDLSRFSWRVYNRYLRSNRIASGVQNYSEVVRLILGVPLDRQGLPLPKHRTSQD